MIQIDEKEYEIQKYQGEHQNEYLISEMKNGKVEGHCELFENGILTLSWMMKDGQRVGRITVYDGGKALFTERWKSILGGDDRKIENSKEGLKLVIRDKNKTMIYQGEFDEELNRHGKGVEYDENGQLKYEGYWDKDELIRIGKEFKGDKMIEFDELSGIDVLSQIPFYVGGYSRVNGEFKRNGIGYLLDKKNGTAIRESKWFNGCEVNGTNLFDGWYVKGMNESIRSVLNGRQPRDVVEKVLVNEKRVEVHNSNELNKMDIDVTSLLISSNSCNELKSLNLNKYRWLKSIEIGDDCLKNVDEFAIDELNNLKSIKIGKNSFTLLKNTSKWDGNKANNNNRSFRILNCGGLESIEIGEYSFCDYGGGFELKNLPKLSTIKIGRIGSRSFNFWSSSFEIKGTTDMILLMNRSSTFEFH